MATKTLSATPSADGVCAARARITVFEFLVSRESFAVAWRYFRRVIDGVVVEIGALNRCGDISKWRLGASEMLMGAGLEQSEAGVVREPAWLEPVCVLDYLAARISHLTSGPRSIGWADPRSERHRSSEHHSRMPFMVLAVPTHDESAQTDF